jgi:alanyl-tRNA synthetase
MELLVKVVPDAGPAEIRTAANELTKKPGRVVLLGAVADARAHLVFAASESVDADMASILKACLPEVEGKGGGSPRIAQGGGPSTGGLPAALERGRALVRR